MPKNIKNICLWTDNPQKDRISNVVKINFNFPCSWTILEIEDIKEIIRLWIKGEEIKYPLGQNIGLHNGDNQGRWMFFNELKKVFNEDLK